MATNVKQTGPIDRITWTNGTGGDLAAGALVALVSGATGRVGLLLVDIADGASGAVLVKGMASDLTAETGVAWAQDDKLYLAAGTLTKTVGTNTPAGRAAVAKLSATAVGELILND